jgi:hypothetical protein
MNVVSIDPAPSKRAIVFDGAYHEVSARDLVEFCRELSQKETLLCWDAPLTGPSSSRGSFSQRLIERFFSRSETGFKSPRGISVLPYSGCPHWAITRSCLGLPKCGDFDSPLSNLPFELVTDKASIEERRSFVIETHPAVAIWLWCRELEQQVEDNDQIRSWVYKGSNPSRTIEEMWTLLTGVWKKTNNQVILEAISSHNNVPDDDDKLDAFVGWVLGILIAYNDDSVGIVGDSLSGAFALPISAGLMKAFETFRQRNPFE